MHCGEERPLTALPGPAPSCWHALLSLPSWLALSFFRSRLVTSLPLQFVHSVGALLPRMILNPRSGRVQGKVSVRNSLVARQSSSLCTCHRSRCGRGLSFRGENRGTATLRTKAPWVRHVSSRLHRHAPPSRLLASTPSFSSSSSSRRSQMT